MSAELSAVGLPVIEVQPPARTGVVRLPEEVVELIDRPEFAVLSTVQPDGSAQLSMMWAGRDGNEIVMATKAGRRKVRNIERDPRVTVLLYDRARPARYAEIRGTARITGEDAHALVDELARRYTGSAHQRGGEREEAARVVLRITPERVLFQA
ncbi:PPOX class F420-dependent oxidoreductase [Actinoplanes derwentensis]|uniref:PPOX class probable F420-dependent enzyme n=1 Tax=Actinoplanes derwentensis TaxID=113562 RepID=A0A1H2BNZ8_9ACTN|nr:PPOX class F420-dependent oxidoreductase [Actinoplanes derwentensis]GID86915.1 PPOX class F420-dependent enzyme [Actinoplanes derwentensis]SDT59933.1 PPOX class probable F420-dependent enzyme [Actinoplanes derwentensis]